MPYKMQCVNLSFVFSCIKWHRVLSDCLGVLCYYIMNVSVIVHETHVTIINHLPTSPFTCKRNDLRKSVRLYLI